MVTSWSRASDEGAEGLPGQEPPVAGAQRWKRAGDLRGAGGRQPRLPNGALRRDGVGAASRPLQQGSEREGTPKGTVTAES